MGTVDFSNIELNLGERITLRLLPLIKSNRFFNSQTLNYLHRLGLLDRIGGVYSANRFGKMYFRVKQKERLKFMIPTVISIVALFAGYDIYKFPLLDEALSTAKTLLIHAMENLGIFP